MFLRGTSSPLASGVVKKALPNGDQYEGQWQEDSGPHGKGKMIYNNGDVYDGRWQEGAMHGMGTYTFARGTSGHDGETRIKGRYRNNEEHGAVYEVHYRDSRKKSQVEYMHGAPVKEYAIEKFADLSAAYTTVDHERPTDVAAKLAARKDVDMDAEDIVKGLLALNKQQLHLKGLRKNSHLKLKTVLNLPAAVAKGLNLPITPFRPPPKEDAARKAAAAARKAAAAAAAAPAATSPPTVPAPFSRVDAGAGAGLRLTASPMFAKLVHPKTGALVDLPAATETSPHQAKETQLAYVPAPIMPITSDHTYGVHYAEHGDRNLHFCSTISLAGDAGDAAFLPDAIPLVFDLCYASEGPGRPPVALSGVNLVRGLPAEGGRFFGRDKGKGRTRYTSILSINGHTPSADDASYPAVALTRRGGYRVDVGFRVHATSASHAGLRFCVKVSAQDGGPHAYVYTHGVEVKGTVPPRPGDNMWGVAPEERSIALLCREHRVAGRDPLQPAFSKTFHVLDGESALKEQLARAEAEAAALRARLRATAADEAEAAATSTAMSLAADRGGLSGGGGGALADFVQENADFFDARPVDAEAAGLAAARVAVSTARDRASPFGGGRLMALVRDLDAQQDRLGALFEGYGGAESLPGAALVAGATPVKLTDEMQAELRQDRLGALALFEGYGGAESLPGAALVAGPTPVKPTDEMQAELRALSQQDERFDLCTYLTSLDDLGQLPPAKKRKTAHGQQAPFAMAAAAARAATPGGAIAFGAGGDDKDFI